MVLYGHRMGISWVEFEVKKYDVTNDLNQTKQSNFSASRNNFIFKYYSLFIYNIMKMYQ